MSKTLKFFAICGAVCVMGIILGITGYAMGGVEDLDKIEETHNWFNIGPQNMQDDTIKTGEYDSIKVKGNMDLAIIGPDLAEEADDSFAEDWVTNTYKDNLAGNTVVQWKNGTEKPEVKVENGVLIIDSKAEDPDFEVNLSDEDASPNILVFVDSEKLKDVDISEGYGDIAIGGINCDTMKVGVNAGDVELNGIKCGDVQVSSKTGDVKASDITGGKQVISVLTGDIHLSNCEGDIAAETTTGDVEFDAVADMSKYAVSLHADTGDVQVNDAEDEAKDFNAEGGPNKLSCKTGTGDIEVSFGVAVIEE